MHYYEVRTSASKGTKHWSAWKKLFNDEMRGATTDFTGHDVLYIVAHRLDHDALTQYASATLSRPVFQKTTIREITAESVRVNPEQRGFIETIERVFKDYDTFDGALDDLDEDEL